MPFFICSGLYGLTRKQYMTFVKLEAKILHFCTYDYSSSEKMSCIIVLCVLFAKIFISWTNLFCENIDFVKIYLFYKFEDGVFTILCTVW